MTPDPPGPPALGTKVHEVVRSSGRDYVADCVVTELDPGVSYRFAGKGTIGGLEGGRAVRPDAAGGGAVFTYTIEMQPTGGMRLLSPVLGPMVRSGLKKDLAGSRTCSKTAAGRPSACGVPGCGFCCRCRRSTSPPMKPDACEASPPPPARELRLREPRPRFPVT